MVHDREDSVRDEHESLRLALRRLGFELEDEELEKLAPQALAVLDNSFSIAKIDLSATEPATAFDPRWEL